ncbi:MAG: hypothetical protein K2J39_11730 [Ruminococcus sp.]|nr:hypothetical protein [Ruminococcus sp.]
MNIKLDDSKPKFDISQWKDMFNQKSFEVPKNEVELRKVFKEKTVSIKYVSDAIVAITKWDEYDLDEECPDKDSKIDKFLELYDVIYPEIKLVIAEPQEQEDSEKEIKTEEIIDIIDTESLNLDDAQEFIISNRDKFRKDVESKIKFNAPVIYDGMPVTVNSKFRIKCSVENISYNNVFILNNELENVIAVGKIVSKEGDNLVTIRKDDIDFSAFRNKTQFNLAVLKLNAESSFTGEMIYKPIKIQLHVMKESERVLCIDFGTSNTTAGSYRIKDEYSNEPELVTFADVTQDNKLVNYFPTIVYIQNCADSSNVKYKFGFEAKSLERKGNYESSASVFYQIKHWLIEDSYYSETIEVFDENGNSTELSKKDIVRAYIKHVISLSEDYFNVRFKELHFTAPVKMKHKFIMILKKILPEYTIVEDAIDEAGAILFDYVSDKFIKWQNNTNKELYEGNVAVIDCGGGTTDLATCNYRFMEEDDITQINRIEINTHFTNGDFNYGGNNITYRIMQLIKLKIAVKYGFISEEEFNKVLERSENDILLYADRNDYDEQSLYRDYIELYSRCEDFLPTQFNNMSEMFYDEDIPKIKRNFYYLWQFAEQVKIIFYREEKEVKKNKWDDAIQTIGDLRLNYLYKVEGDSLVRLESPLDNLEVTITEIRKVIFGDIYNLLNRILNLENGLPNPVYDYYRLSGQSCKINLFNELLKEFIPGKRLRAKMEGSFEHIESISLKKHCIDGSIRYIMNKRLNMQAKIVSNHEQAERIYSVYFGDLNDELPAESPESNALIFYPVKSELDEITVVVRDSTKIIRKINVSPRSISRARQYQNPEIVINELKNGNSSIDWEKNCIKLADLNLNGKNGVHDVVVAVPAGNDDGYGFYIHFIRKIINDNTEEYKVSDGMYYNYERTNSGFFDGLR